jgi:hypothetical protein
MAVRHGPDLRDLLAALRPEDDDEIQPLIGLKTKMLDALIDDCRAQEYKHAATFLKNAKNDLFIGLSSRLQGKTSSRVERLFRTVDIRINVSKWSTQGALNVTKVRLAYYYNGFDA